MGFPGRSWRRWIADAFAAWGGEAERAVCAAEGLEGRRLLSAEQAPTLSTIATLSPDNSPLGVAEDVEGNIYVAEAAGPQSSQGVVYKFAAGTYEESTLATFSGASLGGPLAFDRFGNLYGWEVNAQDGGDRTGAIFEVPVGTHTLQTIVPGSAIGDAYGGLVADPSGNLFVENDSFVELWKIAAGTHRVTPLPLPSGEVINTNIALDAHGDLFVPANNGDYPGTATIFEVPAGTSSVVSVGTVANADGVTQLAVSGGAIYGASNYGGKFDLGTAFGITPGNRILKILLNVDHAVSTPLDLRPGNDGNLFSVPDDGSELYQFFPESGQLAPLSDLLGPSGGNLFSDDAGNLYIFEDTLEAPSHVFRVDGATDVASILTTFPFPEWPVETSFVDSAGNFLGLSFGGGPGFALYEITGTGFDVTPSAPVINYQPKNETGIIGQHVWFNASVNSTPAPTIQWQISTDGGKTFANITGNPTATTESLKLDNLSVDQSGEQFRAVFANALGVTTSNAATLSVLPQLQLVTAAHASAATVTGRSTELSAAASDPSGQGKLTYTWAVIGSSSGVGVKFSGNGTAAAANTRARFTQAGTYTIKCTISDGGVRTIATQTVVKVVQTATKLVISRPAFSLRVNDTAYINAAVYDQFGNAMQPQPAIGYSIADGLGTIDPKTGAFTAGQYSRPTEILATSGDLSARLEINVTG